MVGRAVVQCLRRIRLEKLLSLRESISCSMADPLSVLGAAIGVTSLILQMTDECVKGERFFPGEFMLAVADV